jgi:hypothetical protein
MRNSSVVTPGLAALESANKTSIPLWQFHRGPLRPGNEDQSATVKIHNLVPHLDAVGQGSLNLFFDVVNEKSTMGRPLQLA